MTSQKHIAYLALGANLGDKAANLQKTIEEIAGSAGTLLAISSIYETEPWGYRSSNSFLNMVICIETELSPFQLLQLTQDIEKKIGRKEKTSGAYQDRLIDIDLILFDDLILYFPQLILPHPRFHERKFVLKPLCEIAPEIVHPVFKKTIKELLENQDASGH